MGALDGVGHRSSFPAEPSSLASDEMRASENRLFLLGKIAMCVGGLLCATIILALIYSPAVILTIIVALHVSLLFPVEFCAVSIVLIVVGGAMWATARDKRETREIWEERLRYSKV